MTTRFKGANTRDVEVSATDPMPVKGQTLGVDGSTAASSTNSVPVRDYSATSLSATAVSVTTATGPATLLCNARTTRKSLQIINNSTTVVYVGPSSVTPLTGAVLAGAVGAILNVDVRAAVYAVVGAGTADVRVLDIFE